MDNATKIKDELDVLCTEYKNNKIATKCREKQKECQIC